MKRTKRRKILEYYAPEKKLFAADMAFAVLGAAVAVVIPLLIRYISTTVIYWERQSALYATGIIVALLLGLLLLEMFCNYFVANYGHVMGAKIEYRMRNELFEHYQKLSFTFFDDQRVGQLMSRVTNDLFDISEMLHHVPEELVISAIKLLGTLTALLIINWQLALIAFVPVPFMLWFAVRCNRKMKSAFLLNRARIAEINSTMEDSLSGIRVVKSFANEDVEVEKFRRVNRRFVWSKKKSYRYFATYQTVLSAMTTIITIAVAGGGAVLLLFGTVALPDLLVFLLYISNFTDPIRKLVMLTEQLQNGMSGYTRFREMMEIEPDIDDAQDADELREVIGEIAFNDLTFRYAGGNNIFEHLDLQIPAGEFVALVGPSGVGKTTLCGLIPRFYDVTGGSVTIDGRDVRSITLKSLRKHIGIVQQDVYLFADTVMENIRYGRPDATDEEIIDAAKGANAHDFIMRLPNGYDTQIGQRGIKLSGGQKQRLSIARVLLKDPPILIFDEATSALDNESERVVQESLELLARERTTLVIAHRLSTIHNANRILVMTGEGVAEEGSHRELMSRNGVYASLYKTSLI